MTRQLLRKKVKELAKEKGMPVSRVWQKLQKYRYKDDYYYTITDRKHRMRLINQDKLFNLVEKKYDGETENIETTGEENM